MSELLTIKLNAVRRKRATVTALTGAAMAVGGVVFLLGLTMVLDWWVELPRLARMAMLAVELAVLAYVLVWHILLPIVRGPDNEELALAVEQETPTFRSRLISVIQLLQLEPATAGFSRSMVRALVRETEELAEPMDFTQVVKIDRLTTFATTAAVLLITFGAAVAATAPESIALVQRAVLMNVPVPRKTQVECLSKDMIVPRGEPVTIAAKASGLIIPDSGTVELEFASGVTQSFTMEKPAENPDHYQRTIDNVQDDFTYTVWLNDGHSEQYKVTAAIRPSVADVEVQQTFPTYTGTGTVKKPTGDLTILEGSRLLLNVTANKPVKVTSGVEKVFNYVHLHGVEQDLALAVNAGDPTRLSSKNGSEPGILLPKGTTGFSVHLVDEHGLTSKNPAVYPITLIPDRAPNITITAPRRNDELVTAMATVDIGFDATDDFGISQVLLRYRSVDPDGNVPGATGDGLIGKYFNNVKYDKLMFERLDGEIGFDWGPNSKLKDGFRKGANLAVRWNGQLQPPVAGEFKFSIETKGATVKLYLDGDQVLTAIRRDTASKPLKLNAFQRYDLKVEYEAIGNLGPVRLYWEGPGVPKQVIPRNVLFSVPLKDKTALIASGGVPEKIIQLQVPTDKAVRGYYPWRISEFASGLAMGSVIQWRIEARDNNNVSGPGISFSDTRQLRLVSEADKRKELMDRMGETLTQIDQISDSQRDLRDKTAQIVTGTAVDRPIDLPPDLKAPKK